jgi:signal transduction histidine kinase
LSVNPFPFRLVPIFIFIFLIGGCYSYVYAQTQYQTELKIDSLSKQYKEGHISAKVYLDKTEMFTSKMLAEIKLWKTEELRQLLQLFEEIAWSDEKFSEYRMRYYRLLVQNAQLGGRGGEAVYFLEKASKENPGNLLGKFTELEIKVYFYTGNGNLEKSIEVYEEALPYILHLPRFLDRGLAQKEGAESLFLLSFIIGSYTWLDDSVKVSESVNLANDIYKRLRPKTRHEPYDWLDAEFSMKTILLMEASYVEDHEKIKSLLYDIKILAEENMDIHTNLCMNMNANRIDWSITYFSGTGQFDSMDYYINQFEKVPNISRDQPYKIELYKADLHALRGKYKPAVKHMWKALEHRDRLTKISINEVDELRYAHAYSEQSKLALKKAERQKKNRLIAILCIVFFAVSLILSVYWTMIKQRRWGQKQVRILRNLTNEQIVTMEEQRTQQINEERARMKDDLEKMVLPHLVVIKQQLHTMAGEVDDEQFKNKINKINRILASAYKTAFDSNFSSINQEEYTNENDFEQQIYLLFEAALPEKNYAKEIQIESDIFNNIDTSTRIELLKIIQEAITNIIKHAKAKTVSLLFFKEQNTLILKIKDDGKGFDVEMLKTKNGLGTKSMQERVQQLSGSMNYQSDAGGTEITIFIPNIT